MITREYFIIQKTTNGAVVKTRRIEIAMAEMSMQNNPTATVLTVVDTPVKVAGTSVNGISTSDFVLTNGRITYIGKGKRTFMVSSAIASERVGGSGQVAYTFSIAVNGVVLAKSSISRSLGVPEGAIPLQCLVELDENDYVENFVETSSVGLENVRILDLNTIIK
jgi:hypothetical protein